MKYVIRFNRAVDHHEYLVVPEKFLLEQLKFLKDDCHYVIAEVKCVLEGDELY